MDAARSFFRLSSSSLIAEIAAVFRRFAPRRETKIHRDRHPFKRPLGFGVAVLFVGFMSVSDGGARAEEPKVVATMSCDRAPEPGRVRCSVEARATGHRSLSWADVALLELPDFTSALKGRIGPADATSRDVSSQSWAFGIVARKPGEGAAKARVRAVVCEPLVSDASAPKCVETTVDVRAVVHVG